ncbi:MAG: DUF72 domain-containing protein [Pseudomonadota bacterium]
MAEIRIGTASWTERTLLGSGKFYPHETTTAEGRLRFYAGHFDTVEVDSTYYAPPAERNSVLWANRTPPGFIFNIKAYSMLTKHPTAIKSIPRVLFSGLPENYKKSDRERGFPKEIVEAAFDMFASALRPLKEAKKMGCVVFQFPPWFLPSPESYDWLDLVNEKLAGYCIAVEFRNRQWLQSDERKKVFQFLRDRGMSYVAVDAPWVTGWEGPIDLTTDTPYIRLHGRNREAWFKKGVTTEEKYRYEYNPEELKTWKDRIEKVSVQTNLVFVIFNNCYQDYAIRNAGMMKELFKEKM